MRNYIETDTALSTVLRKPVVSSKLIAKAMIKISSAAKDLDISKARYRELLSLVELRSLFIDDKEKEEYITSDTHQSVLNLFREKVSQHSGIAIEDKDFQKAIDEFIKTTKQDKRLYLKNRLGTKYFTEKKTEEIKNICRGINQRMERARVVSGNNQETIFISRGIFFTFF